MNVLVERYQRRKYVNQPNSQMLYYVRQKSGTVRVMDINKLADAIEANSSLTAGDVKHSIEAFVEQLRLSLTQGDKVKIDGLGTFHITLSSEGAEKEKDCTVRNIRRVNVRFVADKALQGSVVILGGLSLVNSLHAYTFASLKRKKLISTTPLNDALNALILALNASAAAFVLLFTKKFRILS